MTNLHTAVYEEYNGNSHKMDLRWSREISKRLGVKHNDEIGIKFYIANNGTPHVAVRANPDPKKGFRALKLAKSGKLCDRIRFGIGNKFHYHPSSSSIYRFTGKTMYVSVPFPMDATINENRTFKI